MLFKSYVRVEPDGVHFPDAHAGDNVYYNIDMSSYLLGSGYTVSSVTWSLEDGITTSDNNYAPEIATVKIATPYVGIFTATATIEQTDGVTTKTEVVPVSITVY